MPVDRPETRAGITPGHFACDSCLYCHTTMEGDTWQDPVSGQFYKYFWCCSCSTSFVVHFLQCPYALLYIGHTTRPLKTQLGKHASRIWTSTRSAPVVEHGLSQGHTFSDLRWRFIDYAPRDPCGGDRTYRL